MGDDRTPRAVFELLIPIPEESQRTAVTFSTPGQPPPSPWGRGWGRGDTPTVLGLWTTIPTSPPATISFDTTTAQGQPPTDAPTWRVNLPADPEQAARDLDGAERGLETAQDGLTAAADRIDTLIAGQPAGLAFDVSGSGPDLPDAERELLALLEEAERGAPPISFGAGETIRSGWTQATEQFQAFVDQLRRIVSHYAWVETRVQGQLLSRTTVGWTGDMHTAWQAGLDPEQMGLHRRTLTLALSSRQTMIRTFTLAASGAARLSVLLSTPGGAILALPAAWKFINQVRAELEKHQHISPE